MSEGDQSAFQKLFNTNYKYLVAVAYRYFKDEARSKDIVQDAFVALWNKRNVLEIEIGLKPYLSRAVVNKSLNEIKRSKKIAHMENETLPEPSVEPLGLEKLALKEKQKQIQTAINSLPERCRLIFSLSRFEELSHKEIAEKLDISTKTIENQITKALKILRTALGREKSIKT